MSEKPGSYRAHVHIQVFSEPFVTRSAKEVSCPAFYVGTWITRSSFLLSGKDLCRLLSHVRTALLEATSTVIGLPATRTLSPHMCNAWRNIHQSYHNVAYVTSRQKYLLQFQF